MKMHNALLALALLTSPLVACGGGLSHTVDDYRHSEASPEDQKKIEALEAELEKARETRDAKKVALDKAEADESTKEEAVGQAEKDLEVAEAKVNLAEKEEDAGKSADVSGAEGGVDLAKKALEVAKAKLELSEALRELAEAQAEEAQDEWLAAAAKVELAKLEAMGGEGSEHAERKKKFQEQLADANIKHKKAEEAEAEAQKHVDAAREELSDVAGG